MENKIVHRPRIVLVNRALILKDKNILIIQRSNTDTYLPGYWELPGGKLEEGQDILNALEREVLEETNLVVLPTNSLVYYDSYIIKDGKYKDMPYICLLGLVKVIGGTVKISEEHQDYKWVTIDQALEYNLVLETKKALLVLKDKIKYLIK